jgi:hypothetical protein
MPRPSLNAIDTAVLTTLGQDAALVAAGGPICWGRAPQGLTKFVLVSLIDYAAARGLANEDGWETPAYAVQAVAQTSSWNAPTDAADRIHDLLHHRALPALAGSGFTLMQLTLEERIRLNEVDPQNVPTGFLRCGGIYAVMVSSPTNDD